MDQLSDLPKYLETLLRKMPFFPKNQDSSEIQGLEEFFADTSQVMHVRNFSAGDVIIQEGEMARAMFFVLKGNDMRNDISTLFAVPHESPKALLRLSAKMEKSILGN